ncbi:MAG: ABC transporter substrate-binding protein [Alphaproteobacteria bacterium]|nr:ABC transporter substrate-binding protein [Alphaproteobacteria bacterium]
MLPRRRFLAAGTLAAASSAVAPPSGAQAAELYPDERALHELARHEGLVVSLNTAGPPASWGAQVAGFRRRYPEIDVVFNELGSAGTVAALDRARARPVADTAFYYAASAAEAARRGLTAAYKPVNFERLPGAFRDADGEWSAVYALALAFIVNARLVRSVPRSWADLQRAEHRNAVVYLDPRATGIGQMLCLAAAFAAGGDLEDVAPGLDYLASLHKAGNVLRVLATSPLEAFRRGEIPIWIGYEHEGLRLQREFGGDAVAVIVPAEASVAAPFAMSLVRGGPNTNAARLWFNYLMSEPGQVGFAAADLRPSVPGLDLHADLQRSLPPAPQLRALDVVRAAARKQEIDGLWTRIAGG